jgi:hypothetical protein
MEHRGSAHVACGIESGSHRRTEELDNRRATIVELRHPVDREARNPLLKDRPYLRGGDLFVAVGNGTSTAQSSHFPPTHPLTSMLARDSIVA